ncbi:MAG: hypothetical protein CMF31_10810 [Kordiimonas sp.]|nr:hypothetical protein [Kordiimonas sp.]
MVTALTNRAAYLQETDEKISVDDIAVISESYVDALVQGQPDKESQALEVLSLFDALKTDLLQMHSFQAASVDIPNALEELSAVVSATEEAAGTMMSVAETLGDMSSSENGQSSEQLMTLSTQIFEASSFQDITGQRIKKVTELLERLMEQMSGLANMVGDTELEQAESGVAPEEMSNEDLLHGPQLEGQGNSQEDIDALLASFD